LPICPNCDVAYLDGESHTCGGTTGMSWSVAWRTLAGAACGAVGGFVLMTILCDVIKGARNIWCVLEGAALGVPISAAVGSVIAGRRGSRRAAERTDVFNKWGVVSIWVPIATLPAAAVGAQLLSAHRSSLDLIGLLFLLSSASSSVVAARHGSRW
jgi:hypothetical protein